jgi:hypothetical protein
LKSLGTILATIAMAFAAATMPIDGRRLIGFRYRAFINNQLTICPDRVVAQSADVITLSTGERFRVCDLQPRVLAPLLLQANNCVTVDRVHNWLRIREPILRCGCTCEREQWITIPLLPEKLLIYRAADIGSVEPLPRINGMQLSPQ